MAVADLTADKLRELLDYDPQTGHFTRKVRTSNRISCGIRAGAARADGYIKISVLNTGFLAHRLAWMYMTGEWPKQQIDHLNGMRADNRFANLRDVAPRVNQQNQRRAHSRNKSCGLLGATWDARKQKWAAQIAMGSVRHLGYFATPEEAHAAYVAAKRQLHEGCRI